MGFDLTGARKRESDEMGGEQGGMEWSLPPPPDSESTDFDFGRGPPAGGLVRAFVRYYKIRQVLSMHIHGNTTRTCSGRSKSRVGCRQQATNSSFAWAISGFVTKDMSLLISAAN
jgi:hypothetical protein